MASSEFNTTDAGSSPGTKPVKGYVRKARSNEVPWVSGCGQCPYYEERWWFFADAIDQASHHVWVWHRDGEW